ncbi:MAG: 50S ribosomal protein L20 [Bdellovibrionales bacterium CG10_big_fil_rev_8_21_14_0_10_45_34]|nr:MAG: 50S ribosomal protein L20 [Bdellovibrionales bacterium CG10_big_fil_rev_8_21_14_0_10_45_34]
MRVKGGFKTRRRRNKVLKAASGFYSSQSRCFTYATAAVDRARAFQYRDRRVKKRTARNLWTVRINAAARLNGTTYSRLMFAFKNAGIELDRKILADLAVQSPSGFSQLVSQVTN